MPNKELSQFQWEKKAKFIIIRDNAKDEQLFFDQFRSERLLKLGVHVSCLTLMRLLLMLFNMFCTIVDLPNY